MTHSDDSGLVVPPRLAPIHVVIVPIYRKPEREGSRSGRRPEAGRRSAQACRVDPWFFNYEPISVKVDDREQFQPGFKFNEWELKGVPVRVELGPKDLEQERVRSGPPRPARQGGEGDGRAARRRSAADRGASQEHADGPVRTRPRSSARPTRYQVDSYDDFKKKIEEPGGFLWAHWDGTRETEDRIAAETKATIRCIPFDRPKESGKCMVTGQPSEGRVVFAKAY